MSYTSPLIPQVDHFRRSKLLITPVFTNSPLFSNRLSCFCVNLSRAPWLFIFCVIGGAFVESDPIISKKT